MRHSNNVASPRLQGSRLCQTCGEKLPATKRSGRHRLFCSDRCRDVRRRNLNFDFYGSTAQGQAKPRNAKNPPTISKNCKADLPVEGVPFRGSELSKLTRRANSFAEID